MVCMKKIAEISKVANAIFKIDINTKEVLSRHKRGEAHIIGNMSDNTIYLKTKTILTKECYQLNKNNTDKNVKYIVDTSGWIEGVYN